MLHCVHQLLNMGKKTKIKKSTKDAKTVCRVEEDDSDSVCHYE